MPRRKSLTKARLIVLAMAVALLLFVVQQGVATLTMLTAVERERDGWQRPQEILQQLDVHAGNEVFIANTYHELMQPEPILRAVGASMRPGARLVVVERAPGDSDQSREEAAEHHEMSASAAASDITRQGFEEVSREERFIDRSPDGEAWWLVVFRKP